MLHFTVTRRRLLPPFAANHRHQELCTQIPIMVRILFHRQFGLLRPWTDILVFQSDEIDDFAEFDGFDELDEEEVQPQRGGIFTMRDGRPVKFYLHPKLSAGQKEVLELSITVRLRCQCCRSHQADVGPC